jgi:hypothetical protein
MRRFGDVPGTAARPTCTLGERIPDANPALPAGAELRTGACLACSNGIRVDIEFLRSLCCYEPPYPKHSSLAFPPIGRQVMVGPDNPDDNATLRKSSLYHLGTPRVLELRLACLSSRPGYSSQLRVACCNSGSSLFFRRHASPSIDPAGVQRRRRVLPTSHGRRTC